MECVLATSFTSTGRHSSRFYVSDNLCAVITVYLFQYFFVSSSDSVTAYDQTDHNVWRQPFILHHVEIRGSCSSQNGQGGPGENKVKFHSKLMGNNDIRSRKTQGPESRQDYTGQLHTRCPSHQYPSGRAVEVSWDVAGSSSQLAQLSAGAHCGSCSMRISQPTVFTCCQIEVAVAKSESGVAILSLSFKPTSVIHDTEMAEWHPGQCMQIVSNRINSFPSCSSTLISILAFIFPLPVFSVSV